MDVERTIEFILQMQAKSEARITKAEERMDKFDKRLEATRKLVEFGMKLLVKIDQKHLALSEQVRSNAEQIKALTEAQRKTDRKFDRLIDSWTKRRTNGHPPTA
jgi:hypothetical protein